MKIKPLKKIDTASDFFGISILAESQQEKKLMTKLSSADFSIKISERAAANLMRRKVFIQINIEEPI